MVLLFVIMHVAGPLHTDKGSAGRNDHLEVTSHTYEEKRRGRTCTAGDKLLFLILEGRPVDSKQVLPVILLHPVISFCRTNAL